jgi:hypothetical protein
MSFVTSILFLMDLKDYIHDKEMIDMMIMMITMLSFFYDTDHGMLYMNETMNKAEYEGSFYTDYSPWMIQDGYANTRWSGTLSNMDRKQTLWSIKYGRKHDILPCSMKNAGRTCICKKTIGIAGCDGY